MKHIHIKTILGTAIIALFMVACTKILDEQPRSTFTPVFFKKPDNSPYYLPNPTPHGPTRSEGNKIYSDVYVSKSTDLFPAGP